jgi:hypothetical protein
LFLFVEKKIYPLISTGTLIYAFLKTGNMKKIIIFFTSMVFALTIAHGEQNVTMLTATEQCTHCCPQCKKCADKEGRCSKDKCDYVKNGSYYCAKDKTTSELAAKCPACNKDMEKIECKK